MRRMCFVLLFLLPTWGACSFPGQPRYQPLLDTSRPSNIPNTPNTARAVHPRDVPVSIAFDFLATLTSGVGHVEQGYQDSQIDGDTYFVTYINYFSLSPYHGRQIDSRDNKWIKGAQEYALYRAGELTKSKGASYFAVLYQDDWNVLNTWTPQNDVQPGAGLLIRLLNSYPSEIPSQDGRVYDVDMLLQTLTGNNRGLAEYANKTPPDESVNRSWSDFRRWRVLGAKLNY